MTPGQSNQFPCKRTLALRFAGIGLAVLVSLWMGRGLFAAPPDDPPKKEKKPLKEDDGPPEAVIVPLSTHDGVTLKATYYAGTKGKKTVPVVILHEWKGKRGDYKDLALYLQSKGHAVIVPDLRGHGDSAVRGLTAQKTNKKHVEMMIKQDMEAVKRFLRDQNNDEELNIEKLCLIGVEMGAVVACNWALDDWMWPELPTYKQGQDVKALVLISPEWTFKGESVARSVDNAKLQGNLSVMVMVGSQDKKAMQTADKIQNVLKRFHPEPADKEAKQKKSLYMIPLDTSLQGAKMVNQADLKANRYIAGFIDARLVEQSHPWSRRDKP